MFNINSLGNLTIQLAWRQLGSSYDSQIGEEQSAPRQPSMGQNERQSMQSQLEHVRAALNTLVENPPSGLPTSSSAAAMQTPPPPPRPSAENPRLGGGGGGVEGLLEDISSRLANIEGMYSEMSNRLVRRMAHGDVVRAPFDRLDACPDGRGMEKC